MIAAPLYIETLGSFGVLQSGERLPDSVWSREKALMLFQYFVTFPAQLMSKERIVEELWPELDANQADRDFKVAFNALNDALEPDRAARSLAAYFMRQGTSYGFQPEAPIQLDYLRFEEMILAASREPSENAIRHYREALKLYHGDYLPNLIRQDWTAATRERLSSLFLAAATQLAKCLVQNKNDLEGIFWCQRIIATDPLWEEAYRLLMRAYALQANHPLIVKTYERLADCLQRDLGLEPMAETLQLYRQLLEG